MKKEKVITLLSFFMRVLILGTILFFLIGFLSSPKQVEVGFFYFTFSFLLLIGAIGFTIDLIEDWEKEKTWKNVVIILATIVFVLLSILLIIWGRAFN